jgi:DnaK suppressor protein
MESIDKEEIKSKIFKEIEKTERLVAEYKELTKPVEPENAIGRISRMDAINNKSVTEAALRQAEMKLNGLKHTLSQIDSDDFGLCAKCKQPIPLGRILLMPHSRFCISCAQC